MRPISVRRTWVTVLVLASALWAPVRLAAQAMEGTGLVPTGLLLRQMDGEKRVLMIGAHPDDEDTALLATLARGWGAETAYLSLTRGDGGQNLIGGELWEGLGVVRTGELMAARALDGAEQYFTRAFDYGFSKSADEALTFWPREEVLADVVWVIRRFRPQVIVTVWTGTPRDGHGQHQASGILAREAYEAAADPTRFPEQLTVPGVGAWAADKLLQTRRGFGGEADGGEDVLTVETGALDPLIGVSLRQLSARSRSQHRSQDMGAAQPAGPASTGVELISSRVPDAEGGFFAGVDTTLAGLADGLPPGNREATRRSLAAYRGALARAEAGIGLDPATIVPDLGAADRALRDAIASAGGATDTEFARAVGRKSSLTTRALMAAGGIAFQLRALDDLVVPGETVQLQAELWNGGAYSLRLPTASITAPAGWRATERSVEGVGPDGVVGASTLVTWTYDLAIPADADPSKLYYLLQHRDGAMYRWPDDPSVWGLPWDPTPVGASVEFSVVGERGPIGGVQRASAPWRYVGVDPARGQFEKAVLVVPAVGVSVTPAGVVWPAARTEGRSVSVVVRSESASGSRGTVSVRAPAGWKVTPESQPFDLPTAGAARTLSFTIAPNGAPRAGDHVFEVVAAIDGQTYTEGYALIDYEHIERAAMYAPARATVSVVPIRVAEGLRVGYVMGSGDDGPEAIRQMGAEVTLLGEDRVREGDFSGLDAVVLGVRAYETRSDLQAASAQLLDFARAGGTVVMQYNRGPLGNLAPAPFEFGRNAPRVSDETADVRILEPRAPVFTEPNPITQKDFDGWVQERGLYFAAEWDDSYTPLLELHDAGEDPREGSLLIRSVGDGVFVFTGLSFFRQWTDRVPGAYRLFANLVSLDPAAWRAFEQR